MKHKAFSLSIPSIIAAFASIFLLFADRASAQTNTPQIPAPRKVINALSNLTYGTAARQIGTFNGWTMWLGWDGSFSENYDPFSETYYWMVYFAPEGLFVALQSAKSNYSNVDTYAAYDYFYGTLQSPFGPVLPASYIDSLKGVTLSINAFDSSFAPVGPLSQLSMAITSGQSFFRIGSLKTLQRGIQFSAGMNVSFSLLPFSIPFCVSLDYESSFVAGFYPIMLWDIEPSGTDNPVDRVIDELRQIAASADEGSFPGYYEKEIAGMMIPFLETLPSSPLLREFMASSSRESTIDSMISHAQDWLRTGDTSKLPGSVALPEDPAEQYATMRSVKTITDMCFELGYEHGSRARGSDDVIYADCIVTVRCRPAEECTLEVTAEEIADLVPGSQPSDFEGVWIGFDTTPESQISSDEELYWTTIEEGAASYTFVNNTDTPLFLGVQVYPAAVTGNKTIELCRRKVVFEETFVVPETDYDDIDYDNQTISCAASHMLHRSERSQVLPELRRFRDSVLAANPQGRLLIKLYYSLSPAVTAALQKNPDLGARAKSLLFEIMPYVRAAVTEKTMRLPSGTRQKIKDFLEDLAADEPESLRRDISRIGSLIDQLQK